MRVDKHGRWWLSIVGDNQQNIIVEVDPAKRAQVIVNKINIAVVSLVTQSELVKWKNSTSGCRINRTTNRKNLWEICCSTEMTHFSVESKHVRKSICYIITGSYLVNGWPRKMHEKHWSKPNLHPRNVLRKFDSLLSVSSASSSTFSWIPTKPLQRIILVGNRRNAPNKIRRSCLSLVNRISSIFTLQCLPHVAQLTL